MLIATPNHPLYCLDELIETRRSILRYARTFLPGALNGINIGKLPCRCVRCSATRIG
jgi:hypothetical protein